MIEAEHLLEELLARAVEKCGEKVVGQFVVLRSAQRVAAARAMKSLLGRAAFQHAANAQFRRVVEKIERRLQAHAEQQFRHGGPHRGLARFVRPHDDVEIVRRVGKRQGRIGELAVFDQIELLETHGSFSRGKARKQRGTDLLHQRREFALAGEFEQWRVFFHFAAHLADEGAQIAFEQCEKFGVLRGGFD